MLQLPPARALLLLAAAGVLLGCSAPQGEVSADGALRAGPALTDEALAGMYMSRTSDNSDGLKFVACLDNFVMRFDKDAEVSVIFNEISAETDSPVESGNIDYFTDQPAPGRFTRLVDQMIALNEQTEENIFNFDSAGTCVLSPEDCTLPTQEANMVRLYWKTIEHGSMGCYD